VSQAITIRPLAADDASALVDAVRESFSDLRPWMPWCHPEYSLQDANAFIEKTRASRAAGSGFECAVIVDGTLGGVSGINEIDKGNRRANVGYWVRSSMTRRGIATTAVGLLRDWAFAQTDLVRLEILVAAGNAPSQRVAEKAGALREGVLRNRLFLYGVPYDAVMYSLIRA
jgi:ribosomal-protein-serine acetyltransferase